MKIEIFWSVFKHQWRKLNLRRTSVDPEARRNLRHEVSEILTEFAREGSELNRSVSIASYNLLCRVEVVLTGSFISEGSNATEAQNADLLQIWNLSTATFIDQAEVLEATARGGA